MAQESDGCAVDIERATRAARQQLMGAMGVVLLIGTAALAGGGVIGSKAGHGLWMVLPLMIAIVVAALRLRAGRGDARALDAVRRDELRQASLNRAYRDGFFAMLTLQPLLALGLASSVPGDGPAFMAVATLTAGAVTLLASLLWRDR